MNATIAARLLSNRHLLVLSVALILISGLAAWSSLPRIEDPRITTRYATVITRLPGATAERVEALVTMGEEGYMQATGNILACAEKIKQAVAEISELKILGDSLWVIALGSDTLDIYQILDRLTARGWSLNGLHKPACIHLCVTLRHTQEGVAERFIQDLKHAFTGKEES